MIRRRLALFLVLAGLIGGCTRAPEPTPPLELPALERPTAPVTRPARGNIEVPRSALVELGGVPGVFVVEDGRARFRMVRLGAVTRDRAEVLSGLEGGEMLVLGDLADVRDGSPLRSRQPQVSGRETGK